MSDFGVRRPLSHEPLFAVHLSPGRGNAVAIPLSLVSPLPPGERGRGRGGRSTDALVS
jgi:hypothetical protein